MTRVNEMGSLSPPVLWRGLTAAYTSDERQLMRQLPMREQFSLHLLKASFDGVILPEERSSESRTVKAGPQLDSQPGGADGREAPVYIDADDIVFGEEKPKKKRPVYALVWTWKKHKVVKTKALGTRKMRAWKKWQERNGWKVTNHETGYFASRAGELQSMSLHEYDRETNERLK